MIGTFPQQKVPDSEKTTDWFTDCHRWFEHRLLLTNFRGINSRTKVRRNRLFYTYGVISKEEIAAIVNPFQLSGEDVPDNFKNYPITNAHIMTLKGEELKRRFDWGVVVTSRDAISDKEKQKLAIVNDFILKNLTKNAQSKQEVEQISEEFLEDLHTWQDLRETGMSELLTYEWAYLDLKQIFATSFEKELVEGKSIIDIDEYNNIPSVECLDSQTVQYLRDPRYPLIKDIDAVVIEQFIPISQVKDRYYEFLSPDDVDYLDKRFDNATEPMQYGPSAFYTQTVNSNNTVSFRPIQETGISSTELAYDNFGGYFDASGNVRIIKVRWIGERRVGFLSFFDENGEPQETIVPSEYKVDPLKGESIRWRWINEAYESTRIGKDIFVKQQVRNVQFRKLDNKSYCSLGIVGLEYDICLFDIMKRYQVLYDVYMWRLEEAFAKSLGKIGILDAAALPEGWDIEKAMYYAVKMGWMITDSFKENKKGNSVGSLSGQQRELNIEQYEGIQQMFNMLNYIEMQLDKVVGINSQRKGQVQGSDPGLGVTQEAIQASSNITETYFYNHDLLRLEVLRKLAEVSKFCLRNGSESLQYAASDATIKTFTIDGKMINEADYNVHILNSNIDSKAEQMLQEGIKIGFQTGQVDLIQMMDIYSNDTISSIRNKLTKSIRKNQKAKQQEAQAQQNHEKEIQQMQLQQKQLDRDILKYRIDTEAQVKIEVAQISALGFAEEKDVDNNGIPDVIETGKLALANQEFQATRFLEEQKLLHEKDNKKKELSIKEREISSKQSVEREKLKQIDLQNKSQEKMQNKEITLKEKEMKNKLMVERLKIKAKPKVAKKK